jgi:CRISPR-associated protein Csb2
VWKRTLKDDTLVNMHLPVAIAKLIDPPIYKLPPAVLTHTRHYMPQRQRGDTALVFDGFVAVSSTQEVGVMWSQADLSGIEQEAISRVLNQLGYLGRAESWCVARICADWNTLTGETCAAAHVSAHETQNHQADTTEPVRLLCAAPETWNRWSYVRRAKPDPCWNLLAETVDLHAEGWSDPPGSQWVTYLRPRQALTPPPPLRRISRQPANSPHLLRFVLDGPVLPQVTETVYVAELARNRVQGIFGKLFDRASSPVLSGKLPDGTRLVEHRHAYFLPTDEDGDGKLDHIVLYAAEGLGTRELQALDAWRETRGPGNITMGVVWLGHENGLQKRAALTWRSVTPFIATRHYKERGIKRDSFPHSQLAAMNLREELAYHGLPSPIRVDEIDCLRLPSGRVLNWRGFRQQRVLGTGRRGHEFGKGFEIEFAEPVSGPIAVGYACHYGLGMFAPVEK